jgi:hypothetical protein
VIKCSKYSDGSNRNRQKSLDCKGSQSIHQKRASCERDCGSINHELVPEGHDNCQHNWG